jgi:membrane protein DedA with SNARE-associated domain
MEHFIDSWGHLGVFIAILATGLGFPMPEELPIVLGGAMANSGKVYTWSMLPVCIVAVIIGDSFLYLIGRFWGSKLIEMPFIRRKLLPPERLAKIADNFKKYGVGVLLFARLTPGFRAPIFLTAGITKMPIMHFLLADGVYAIPGVSILFFLGYWFTDSIIDLVQKESEYAKPIIVVVVLAGIGLYVVYRFWRKPMVTGNPKEMPPIVGQVTTAAESMAEKVAVKVMQRLPGGGAVYGPPPKPPANVIGRGLPPKSKNRPVLCQQYSRPPRARLTAKCLGAQKKKNRIRTPPLSTYEADANGQATPHADTRKSSSAS